MLYWLVSSVILRGTFKDEHWYLVFRKLPSVLLDGTISTSERGTISVVSSGMSFPNVLMLVRVGGTFIVSTGTLHYSLWYFRLCC